MKIHLTTVVGGFVEVLPHMLEHYRALGVDSFLINVHVSGADDPALERVRKITGDFGCEIASVTMGPWRQEVNPAIYESSRALHPDDWFVIADQDELQTYPDGLRRTLEYCDAHGFDYVEGGFIDRLGAEGSFPAVSSTRSIWEQFPLGGFISTPLLDANPNKIVAAKGHVKLLPGQHGALSGRGAPVEECYAQVHHFKWTDGILSRLEQRAAFYQAQQDPLWQESARFVEYAREHGNCIDISDPEFYVAPCSPHYPYWNIVTRWCWREAQDRLSGWDLSEKGASSNG